MNTKLNIPYSSLDNWLISVAFNFMEILPTLGGTAY